MESSAPAGQKIPTLHHPEGINPEQMFFQETRVHELIWFRSLQFFGKGFPFHLKVAL
jgi:hypothetical protein